MIAKSSRGPAGKYGMQKSNMTIDLKDQMQSPPLPNVLSRIVRSPVKSSKEDRQRALGLDPEELIDPQLVAIDRGIGTFPLAKRDIIALPLRTFERQTQFG